MIIRVCVIVSVVLCLSVIVDVVKVTQNWSLECKIDVCWKCKIDVCWKCKIGAELAKLGPDFGCLWEQFGS